MGIGAINLLFTLVGMALIDRAGRKFLLYAGSVGYIVSLGMTAYGFGSGNFGLVLPFIMAFIAAHAIGQGAVIWVFISEIFPSAARGKGQSLGAGTHWVFAAALTLVMPGLLASVPPVTIFLGFAAIMVLHWCGCTWPCPKPAAAAWKISPAGSRGTGGGGAASPST